MKERGSKSRDSCSEKITEYHPKKFSSNNSIYKSLIAPFLDCGDIIYHQSDNGSFCQKIESIQYKVALAITGAIHGISHTKLYKE